MGLDVRKYWDFCAKSSKFDGKCLILNLLFSEFCAFLHCAIKTNHSWEKVDIGQFNPYLKTFTLNSFTLHTHCAVISWSQKITVSFQNPSVSQTSTSSVIVKQKTPTLLTPQLMHERQEVERICLDLLRRFQHACVLHPKTQAKVWMAKSVGEDPLLITTRLITDSLARLRIFVHSLDPMNWLMWHDRHILYRWLFLRKKTKDSG